MKTLVILHDLNKNTRIKYLHNIHSRILTTIINCMYYEYKALHSYLNLKELFCGKLFTGEFLTKKSKNENLMKSFFLEITHS